MGCATTLQLSILRSFRKRRLWPPRVRLCSASLVHGRAQKRNLSELLRCVGIPVAVNCASVEESEEESEAGAAM
jgi:hypothetical protein